MKDKNSKPKKKKKNIASDTPKKLFRLFNIFCRTLSNFSSTCPFFHNYNFSKKVPTKSVLFFNGSGKSFLAKIEMIFSILATTDEILIVDPEREYTAIAELPGGEVIYISANSTTHINPLDLTENPDKDDKEYDPIKAKLDFLLSFFSCILGNQEITPIQKTIIDNVMHETYKNHENPTLKEYYEELEKYEEEVAADETKSSVTYLKQTS